MRMVKYRTPLASSVERSVCLFRFPLRFVSQRGKAFCLSSLALAGKDQNPPTAADLGDVPGVHVDR
jgi:hypothetical protein